MQENTARKISIVIPVYNEEKTIKQTLDKVLAVNLPTSWQKEIIVVNDGSYDKTAEILKDYREKVRLLNREQNGGKGAALKAAFMLAAGDFILIQDADAEYDPDNYSRLLEPITNDKTQTVFGSRVLTKNNVPFSRIYFYGGLVITKIFNFLFGNGITDLATCYKVFPRKYVADLVNMPSDDFVFDVVELSYVLLRKEKHIHEVPISYVSRHKEDGKKMNWRQGWRCFRKIFSLFIAEKFWKGWSFVKRIYDNCSNFVRGKEYLPVLLTFSLFFTVFFVMYFSLGTLSSSDDHYFHFRFAEQIREHGFFDSFQNFKAIYFSKIAEDNSYFVYYNFLFYLLILPFTFISPLYLGIKFYAVTAAAFAFSLLYWCFKKLEIKNPFVWILLITAISSTSSVWRFFLSRPYVLAPSLLLLLLVFLYRKNYIGVAVLCFIYLYWHSATFFMPLGVAVVYFVIEWFYRERKDYKILYSALGGTLLAFLLTFTVSSGFLSYMKEIIFGTYWETILGKKVNIVEGGELYPLDFFNVLQSNALMFAAFVTAITVDVFGYVAFKSKKVSNEDYFTGLSPRRRYLQTTVLVLTAVFFLGTVSASARFGDYFTMFAGLYVALSFDYILRSVNFSGSKVMIKGIVTGLSIVLIYLFFSNILFLQQKIARGSHPTEMYQVGMWLNHNTQPGDIIFMPNWSWFTQLYYYAPQLNYPGGLEPRFTYVYNPNLYWLWTHIVDDAYVCELEKCPEVTQKAVEAFRKNDSAEVWAKEEGDKIADRIRNDFGARVVVTSRDYLPFNYIMDHNNNFTRQLYNAEFGYSIYTLKPGTTTPAKRYNK